MHADPSKKETRGTKHKEANRNVTGSATPPSFASRFWDILSAVAPCLISSQSWPAPARGTTNLKWSSLTCNPWCWCWCWCWCYGPLPATQPIELAKPAPAPQDNPRHAKRKLVLLKSPSKPRPTRAASTPNSPAVLSYMPASRRSPHVL
ncbi:hypothetical protein B0I35DRAFT_34709 [Stachybotrys elegans]|uniref:Uncharacterized protein n=1 Tax=Stachybotrys elegans TaxID=80388 RepID=A0A8K0T369_9HYPO|nr:hypothetical protein B0I35DRAFT_34709 [Stachybotrys elegans]